MVRNIIINAPTIKPAKGTITIYLVEFFMADLISPLPMSLPIITQAALVIPIKNEKAIFSKVFRIETAAVYSYPILEKITL